MTFDRRARIRPSLLWPAICFLTVAQLFLALAPLIEARGGSDARSHVETAGTRAHHAHNAEECAVCAARNLQAVVFHSPTTAVESMRTVRPPSAERDEHLALLTESESRPRAPPFRHA